MVVAGAGPAGSVAARDIARSGARVALIDALNQSQAIQNVMLDLVAGRQTYRGLKRRLLGTLEMGLMWRALTT